MTLKRYLLSIMLGVGLVANAQSKTEQTNIYNPYVPAGLPMGLPEWMLQLEDLTNINYYDVMNQWESYLNANPDMRVKTPMNKSIINHFQRWNRAVRPYVQKDGSIRMPSVENYRNLIKEANRANNSELRAERPNAWRILAPMETYDIHHKRMTPAQANVQRFDVSTTHPNILYCGTETGIIFKTTDKGENWRPCTPNHYFGGEITTVEISEQDPNKVLVGAGSVLWLTTDGGDSWREITPPQIRLYMRIRDAVLHPTDDNIIIVGNDQGVYRSTNGGSSWQTVENGQCFDIKFKHGDPNTVYTLVRSTSGDVKFKVSRNAGVNFTTVNTGYNGVLSAGRIGLSAAAHGQDYIYIWGCTGYGIEPFFYGPPILLKSTDGGTNWTHDDTIGSRLLPHDKNGGQGYYDMVVTASNTNPEHILVGLLQLYSSPDGGRTFNNLGGYYGKFDLHCDMQDIHVNGSDTWLSTDGGIIYSSDFFTDHAEARIRGIYASEMWGFDIGWNEDVMVGGRNHNGNMSQLDRYNGITISMRGSENATGYVFLSNPRKVAYSDSDNVFLPDDWRSEFVQFHNFWQYPAQSTMYGVGFEYDPRYAKSFLIVQGSHESDFKTLWKTVDDGESFTALYTFAEGVTAYAISRTNPNKIVVATIGKLYHSLDAGKTFEEMTIPEEMTIGQRYKIAIHPRNENEIWVTTHEGGAMFRTLDGGRVWSKINEGLEATNPLYNGEMYAINRFFMTGNSKNAIYAIGNVLRRKDGTYSMHHGRIFYYDDIQKRWTNISEGLPPVIATNRLLPFYKKGIMRLATNNGIWERPLVDPEFKPIAQPIILDMGTGQNTGEREVQLDSYSIVNQKDAQWSWTIHPEPISITSKTVRNPRIKIAANQSYDITLSVTTPGGTDTKTVRNMILGDIPVPTGATEALERDIYIGKNVVHVGEPIHFTSHGLTSSATIQVYNASGKLIHTAVISANEPLSLSTDSLPSGMYIYTIQSEGLRKTGRFVVRG